MTEILLSVSRHQPHCVFSVEFVVFQSRMGEDMLDALIVAFYSYYKQRLKKNKRCTGLCGCGFSENTRPSSDEFLDCVYSWLQAYTDGLFFLVVLLVVVKLWASYLVCLRNSQTIHVTGSRFFEKMVII